MKKILLALALAASILLCSCSEADKANANISKQADYFESERKITVYNARTDKISSWKPRGTCLSPTIPTMSLSAL